MDVREAGPKGWRVFADRGGTFTDLVAIDPDGHIQVQKLLSQSDHYEDPILEGISRLTSSFESRAQLIELAVGTTVATNAFLERKGKSCALVTTLGFRDILEIRGQNRADLFALQIDKPQALCDTVTEVPERILSDGSVEQALNMNLARFELSRLRDMGYESLAISLMNASQNPAHELALGELARDMGFKHVALGHQLAKLDKYVLRTETAVFDAYLTPVVRKYTAKLCEQTESQKVFFMQSHGGLCQSSQLTGPHALLSGPAGGLIASIKSCQAHGYEKVITFDMGGTSTDVAIYSGNYTYDHEPKFHGYQIQVPMLDIHTVAAGGGSILKFDGERFQVGPESAGADPGPACYRKGGPLTVTDANLFLKRIRAEHFPKIFGPSQDQSLDEQIVAQKFSQLSQELNLPAEDIAKGFLDVAVETMVRAIKSISIRKGHDPQDFVLCCFGGAGAQLACPVAERLGIKKVFIHPLSSVLSAFGMSLADEKSQLRDLVDQPLHSLSDEDFHQLTRKLSKHVSNGMISQNLKPSFIFHLKLQGSETIFDVAANDPKEASQFFSQNYTRIFGLEADAEKIILESLSVEMSSQSRAYWFKQDFPASPLAYGPCNITLPNSSLFLDEGWTGKQERSGEWLLQQAQNRHVIERPEAVELEIFYQKFQSLAEEMGSVLRLTGFSVNIRERLDFSCAVFTASGELIANAPHIPVHLGSMGECLKVVVQKFAHNAKPGDSFISNSPLFGGTHLPDITVMTPVFWQGKIVNWLASRGHHADVGGSSPGSMPALSKSLSEEGVVIEPQYLVREGKFLGSKILELLTMGSMPARKPEQNILDLKAQLAANRRGLQIFEGLLQEYGLEHLEKYSEKLLAYSADRILDVTQKFDGRTAQIDLDEGRSLKVALKVRPQEGLDIDLSSCSDRGLHNFNTPQAVVRAAVLFSLRCVLKEDIPLNDGIMRVLNIRISEGSILDPSPTSAIVAGNVETSQALCDLLLDGFVGLAHCQGTMNNVSFGNEHFQYYETLGGGSGAGAGFHGASCTQVHMTNSVLTDPEVLERRFPVVLRNFARRWGSGGLGKFSGGDGMYRQFELAQTLEFNVLSQRRSTCPKGRQGGDDGLAGRNSIEVDLKSQAMAGCFSITLQKGDLVSIETPGGGGYGSPDLNQNNLIFAYGSNLDPLQIKGRCPSARIVCRAVLPEYSIGFSRFSEKRQGGVADIVPKAGAEVWGLVYSLSPEDLAALDEIEGHPDHYERVELEVKQDTPEGPSFKVWAYQVKDKEHHIPPTEEYLWLVHKGQHILNAPRYILQSTVCS
ncbi:hydantoinase B/oxoprolinase family protein [Pseudobacteriovorax antillogorgiicola]|uniref:5-oxoprolinase (ATP-hydrolysing) n=1 Tax=Pseudobacteriovorax antillogorgiicola TaxID=1513793 RepID=A0A1Y6CCX8_9BACT|nr:hydantoinase B/oxoprolinase family protein [Pseudobacteriovorax antillogorgiicola]TCS48278.1 5-oxoprolinase (ATP-hydrolysing) [Pseudobacteriovorax antillogorgiicola]SMF57020.1 5-oxoprolinase (ATP-hydrolysing) [Pseudobacteriovorax antillogorgiicola]